MIGSFLNVLVYRLPLQINIAIPRSSCPLCKAVIPWYRNIPIVSFCVQRGRCASCCGKISSIYPFVEILSGVTCVLLAPSEFTAIGLTEAIVKFSIFSVFLVQFIIDIRHQILDDYLTLYLALLFLFTTVLLQSWTYWLLGGLLGFAFPYLVMWIFYRITGKIGLGGGDIKLYGALGIGLGPLGVLYNIFLSCLLGSIVGILLIVCKVVQRKDPIPFGPFIIVIALFQIFFQQRFEYLISIILLN